jgi:hypothetical protein
LLLVFQGFNLLQLLQQVAVQLLSSFALRS